MTFLRSGQNQISLNENQVDFQNKTIHEDFVFIAKSSVMKLVHNKIKKLAFSSSPVLILGDSGSGKTTVAREIFNENRINSLNKFIKIFCSGLNQETIEAKLFGDVKQKGLLNCGSKNTLFIKGLDCWSPSLQKRFLSHVLNHKNKSNLPRLICSVGESFSRKVKEGHFSHKLFEILSQNLLMLPSLSERQDDIVDLIGIFNKEHNFYGHITSNALQVLKSHNWKENITELKNVCLQISILLAGKEYVIEKHLDEIIPQETPLTSYNPEMSLEDLINNYIQMSLIHFQSKKKSAQALGISVKTIYNKIKTGRVSDLS